MTIGPAPMMSTVWMSLRLGMAALAARSSRRLHQVDEAVEQVADVVRTGRRFRMALEAEGRLVDVGQPLQGAVEERHMGCSQGRRQGGGIDREAVVLAGDADPARVEILDRVI